MGRLRRQLSVLALTAPLLTGCASTNPYLTMGPDSLFEAGMRTLEEENWGDAQEIFDRFLLGFPSDPRAADARFHLAEAFFEDGKYLTAAAEYTRFLDRFSSDDRVPRAALMTCRSYVELSPHVQRDQRYTRQAYQECFNAARDFAGTEEGARAAELRDRMWEKLAEDVYVVAEYYFERDFWDSAIRYFERVVASYPGTRAAPEALKRLYEANLEIGYGEEAEAARQRLLEEYPDSPAAREIRADGG